MLTSSKVKVFASGVGKAQMIYRPERENPRADALSHNLVTPTDHNDQAKPVQFCRVTSMDISQLLKVTPKETSDQPQGEISQEQCKYSDLKKILASNVLQSQKINGILYYVNDDSQTRSKLFPFSFDTSDTGDSWWNFSWLLLCQSFISLLAAIGGGT